MLENISVNIFYEDDVYSYPLPEKLNQAVKGAIHPTYIKTITNVPHIIKGYLSVDSNKDKISLIYNYLEFTEDLSFKISHEEVSVYNLGKEIIKDNGVIKDILNKEYLPLKENDCNNDCNKNIFITNNFQFNEFVNNFINPLLIFSFMVIEKKNPYLLEEITRSNMFNKIKYNSIKEYMNTILNFYINAVLTDDIFEKVLKSNKGVIISNISNDSFILNDGKKVSQIVSLPKFVLDFLDKNNLGELTPILQELDIDGNDYHYIVNFIESMNIFVEPLDRVDSYSLFLTNLQKMIKEYDYNLSSVLSHLVKEKFYRGVFGSFSEAYNGYDISSKYNIHQFGLPNDELELWIDYISMCIDNNFNIIKYPEIYKAYSVTKEKLQ